MQSKIVGGTMRNKWKIKPDEAIKLQLTNLLNTVNIDRLVNVYEDVWGLGETTKDSAGVIVSNLQNTYGHQKVDLYFRYLSLLLQERRPR
jgi:DNA primase catalytic subunit